MPPKLVSDDGRHVVIRPLAYCREADLAAWAEVRQFPIIPCDLCGSQETLQRAQAKAMLAEQIYQGYWFDSASGAAKASIEHFAKFATGTIRLDLYKGHALFAGAVDVPNCVYSETAASMEKVGEFNHADSEGFLNVLGVSARILARTGQSAT